MPARILPIFLSILGGSSVCAANYQWKLKGFKEDEISMIKQRINSDPIQCPSELSKLTCKDKYRRVSLEGRIDVSNTIILGHQPPPQSHGHYLISNPNGSYGGYVYSQFKTEDNQIVIVNRGWIPNQIGNKNDDISNYIGDPDKPCTYRQYEGIISPLENPPFCGKEEDNKGHITSTVWQFKNNKFCDVKKKYHRSKKQFIVVDILQPPNDQTVTGIYPHRLTEDDILNNMVHTPPSEHLIYCISFLCSSAMFFGFAYSMIRFPRNSKRFHHVLKHHLTSNQYKIEKGLHL